MSHVDFDESKLNYLLDKSKQVTETVSQSFNDLNGLEGKLDMEFGRSLADISNEINHIINELDRAHKAKVFIEQKIENAQSKIQPVPNIPPPSDLQEQSRYADEKARAEQERRRIENNNDKLCAEISRLQNCKVQLAAGISELDSCLQELRTEQSALTAARSKFDSIRSSNNGLFQRNVNDMGLFYSAFHDTCNKAEDVVRVKSNYALDAKSLSRYFTINSESYPMGGNSRRDNGKSSVFSSTVGDSDFGDSSRVLIIKEKRREKVFEIIEKENSPITIKIPIANYYPLGGQVFIDEMQARSFNLIKNGDSMFGNDGYIIWEK